MAYMPGLAASRIMNRTIPVLYLSAMLLTACGPSETVPVVPSGTIRMVLPAEGSAPAPAFNPRRTVGQSSDPQGGWTLLADGRTALYGLPGARALIAIECEGRSEGTPQLIVTRYAPAERGAEAVFAIQGNRRILRVPMRAVSLKKGESAWRGSVPVADERVQVFLGEGQIAATLPGAGRLVGPSMGAARAGIDACIAAGSAPQTLPNRASNPAKSPAAR